MPNKVYFEVAWDNKHFFLDCEPTTTIDEVKRMIHSCYPEMALSDFTLAWKPKDGSWTALEDAKSLSGCGLSANNSPAENPSYLGLLRKGETVPKMDSLSEPPELPDNMRISNDNQA
ncbi:hypothetical protein PFISCL1PPCAC_10118 [Pristionchus fissidentatus]|uniref:Ubiquitin-like domain-containing protein n=1 Tax=Pristionchus fissidentatus TaxID=1538716 RepID=A0AAV5VHF2_9BILA|nr:hypothetical protein PFISCL1PPCAC_10118 [Pristionchus fissidentatus]